jgi:anti-repressor protein
MELDTYDFNLFPVRVALIEGAPWFALGDVCRALNLTNPSMVAQRLQPQQRSKLNLGRQGEALFISESGLYRTVLRSDSPQAEPFQVWVTEDVLPTVRKTGTYSLAPAVPAVDISDPLVLAQKFIEAETHRRTLVTQVETMTPKAQVYDALVNSEGSYSVAEAAKILGTGELRLFRTLRERNILMDAGKSGVEHHNVPYQAYLERGYFELVTRPRPGSSGSPDRISYTTRVTAKGLAWLQKGLNQQNLQLERPA